MILENIEAELSNRPLITVHNYVHNDKESLVEFVYNLLSAMRDNGCNECKAHCYRSLGDIFRAAKTYRSTITFKDILKTIFQNNELFFGQYCNEIKKYTLCVFRKGYLSYKWKFEHMDENTEFDYSINELLELC